MLAGLLSLARFGKIESTTGQGKAYIWLTILTCLTSLPVMKTGHFTGAHGLAIIVLVLLGIGIYITSVKFFGKAAVYLQVILMSTTLFLSFIPAIVETTTRLPISHPLADGPNSPVVQMNLMILVALYAAGVLYQLIRLYNRRKIKPEPDTPLKFS